MELYKKVHLIHQENIELYEKVESTEFLNLDICWCDYLS